MKSVARIIIGVLLFLTTLVICEAAFGQQQQQEETVSVPKSMLSKDQLEALAQKNLQERVQRYGNWVGIGHGDWSSRQRRIISNNYSSK